MAFKADDHDIEVWLRLEDENVLQKICNIYDLDGLLSEQYKTRLTISPKGVPVKHGKSRGLVFNTPSASPSLYRSFNYDDEGNWVASLPSIREWTQECEDAAQGADPSPGVPGGIPGGLKVANAEYIYGEALSVVEGTYATVVSKQLLLDEVIHLRHVVVSGDNQAKFQVLVNGNPLSTKRTWFGIPNEDFWFNTANGGILYGNEELIEVEVLNCGEGDVDFESSIGYVVKSVG